MSKSIEYIQPWDRTEPEIHVVGDARRKIKSYGKLTFWPDKYVCRCGSDKFYVGGDQYAYSTEVQCVDCGRIAEVHNG